ncbi:MAG: UbiD family decarboxylase [Candidatus Hadarchaeota archaeon]
MSLRELIEKLKENRELTTVDKKVSPKYEIAKRLQKTENAVRFKKVAGSKYEVVGNILGSRKRIAEGLGIPKKEIIDLMRESISSKKKPETTDAGPVQEIVEEDPDLRDLPILKHFEKDGGPYITSSIIVAEDSKGTQNLSFHRMQLLKKNKLAVRIVPRNLHKMFTEAETEGRPLKIAAILGIGPALALAAATSLDYEVNEYEIAYALSKNFKLTECKTVPLKIPSSSEIILEGELLAKERVDEGPFTDITGTYDAVRKQPVFNVKCITHRRNPIYQALLPASKEHQLLMGLPREPIIFEKVEEVAKVKDVALTTGGCGWLHAVISIKKENPKDVKRTIDATFKAHSSLKHLVVVDEDINVHNHNEVEWAIATRFRGDRDSYIRSKERGSSLDPTADPETRIGCKTALDATKNLDRPDKFERAKIPD